MTLKSKLQKNQLTIGSWVTIGHPSIIEIMATAGFEWLTIDMEHSSIDFEKAQDLIASIQANKISALVRVGKNDDAIIKRVLDIGADGVIVPMVNSKDDAIKAVENVKYPPFGKRGVGLYRAQKYGIGFEEYTRWLKDCAIIIAQIEHIDAVNNLKDILSVEGIDGIIVGPYDLSGSLGMPGRFESPEFKNALKNVVKTCKKCNKSLGYHVIMPDYLKLKEKIDEGYTFLGFSLDFYFLGEKARNEMKKLKGTIK